MTQANEITIQGRYCRIDTLGYENNPDYEGRITVVSERDIEVPAGLMDVVSPANDYWNEQVVVHCQRMPGGQLDLLAIDFDEGEEDGDQEPGAGQSPQMTFPMLSGAGADSMAAQLFDHIANSSDAAVTLPISYWKAARRTEREGYRHWEITMHDESVVEVNPIPSQNPDEPWLWAVLYNPDSDRTLLTQGNATPALHEACNRIQ